MTRTDDEHLALSHRDTPFLANWPLVTWLPCHDDFGALTTSILLTAAGGGSCVVSSASGDEENTLTKDAPKTNNLSQKRRSQVEL